MPTDIHVFNTKEQLHRNSTATLEPDIHHLNNFFALDVPLCNVTQKYSQNKR